MLQKYLNNRNSLCNAAEDIRYQRLRNVLLIDANKYLQTFRDFSCGSQRLFIKLFKYLKKRSPHFSTLGLKSFVRNAYINYYIKVYNFCTQIEELYF